MSGFRSTAAQLIFSTTIDNLPTQTVLRLSTAVTKKTTAARRSRAMKSLGWRGAEVGTAFAYARDCSAIEADRLAKRASHETALRLRSGQARNLGRGRRTRKSPPGRESATRRGPGKAEGGGGVDQRRLHGARRRTRGRKSSGGERAGRGLTPHGPRRIAARSKALETTRMLLEPTGNRRQGAGANGRRATAGESPCGRAAGKTPGERTLDVAAG